MDYLFSLESIWTLTLVLAYIVFVDISKSIKFLHNEIKNNQSEINELKNRISDLEN